MVSKINLKTYETKRPIEDDFKNQIQKDDEFPLSRINTNLHFGAGLSSPLSSVSLVFDVLYILGLSDHFPDSKYDNADDKYTAKSHRIGVSVGVMYPLN